MNKKIYKEKKWCILKNFKNKNRSYTKRYGFKSLLSTISPTKKTI